MANRDEWPALGRGVPEQARTGVHVRFDAPTPMDRDDGGQRGVPRPRRDVHFNPVGFAFDQPRGPPRGQHFPHRRRGRGNRTHGTQFTPCRTSSSIPKPRELPHLSTSAKRGVDIRQWIVNNNTSNTFRNNSTSKRITFRVMSYNVLAQCNVAEHADLYRGVDNHFLQKTRRKQVLLEEIKLLHPDVFCLQECEDDVFTYFSEMLHADYRGVHAKRGGGKKDGCSVFFKTSKFILDSYQLIDFEREEFGLKSNAAVICTLQLKGSNSDGSDIPPKIVVGCIHGLFNPRRGDYKLGQMRVFLQKIQQTRVRVMEGNGDNPDFKAPHAVITGDFNCSPSSPLYHFLLRGEIDVSRVDRRFLAGVLAKGEAGEEYGDEFQMLLETGGYCRDDDEWLEWNKSRGAKKPHGNPQHRLQEYYWDEEGVRAASGKLPGAIDKTKKDPYYFEHALKGKLQSCYASLLNGQEPPVTSQHRKFKGTVDYIFHTSGLVTEKVLMPPSKVKNGTLPTEEFASDHFSIVADFAVSI